MKFGTLINREDNISCVKFQTPGQRLNNVFFSIISCGDKHGTVHFWEEKTAKKAGTTQVLKRACLGAVWNPQSQSALLAYGQESAIVKWS